MGIITNAEGLPIESIDKIELTLNPQLASFINWDNRNKTDKYLNIRYIKYFGLHYYLDIQAQYIYKYPEIKLCIAHALYELMDKDFITFQLPIPYIYQHIDYFVHEVREIEFAFDFKPEAVHITHPEKLIHCEDSVYTIDRRVHEGRPSRKSLAKQYDHNESLRSIGQTSFEKIEDNPYSQRIEFCLSKYNCKYRTMNNIFGSPYDVIQKYIPYLAVIYHRFLYGNIVVDTSEHPFFNKIYALSEINRQRYTGDLETTVTHVPSDGERAFFISMIMSKMAKSDTPPDILALLALTDDGNTHLTLR